MLPALNTPLGALESVEVWTFDVELFSPVEFAGGTHDVGRRAFVRVCTAEGEGFGEIGALEQPVGADPSLGAVLGALKDHWIPRLVAAASARDGQCPGSEAIALLGSNSPLDRVCAAGIEMAVLDAELRRSQRSLRQWLGVETSAVPFGGLLGLAPEHDLEATVRQGTALLEQGASRLRVKISPGNATSVIGVVRSAFPQVALQADANGSFTMAEANELIELDAFDLACVEEPLAGRDFATTAQLASQMSTPICLDESVQTPRHAADALRYEAAQVLCLKPARLGGLRQTLACQQIAERGGASWFMGGLFEAGLGRAYLGALAAREGARLVSDVASPSTYLRHDPCGLSSPSGGLQTLWDASGVGPWPTGTHGVMASWSR